jgi:hypothetical protein
VRRAAALESRGYVGFSDLALAWENRLLAVKPLENECGLRLQGWTGFSLGANTWMTSGDTRYAEAAATKIKA